MIHPNKIVSRYLDSLQLQLYTLVGIVTLLAVIVFSVYRWETMSNAKTTFITHDFYLNGVNLSREARVTIDNARFRLLDPSQKQAINSRNIIANTMYTLSNNLSDLIELHERYMGEDFIALIEKVQTLNRQIAQFDDESLSGEALSDLRKSERIFNSIYATAHQLESQYLKKIDKRAHIDNRFLQFDNPAIILLAFTMLVAIFVIHRIIKIIHINNARERQVSLALYESEQQVRLLLESTGEAIYGIDTEGRCTFANPACASVLGYDKPDILNGSNMHELIHHHFEDGDLLSHEG